MLIELRLWKVKSVIAVLVLREKVGHEITQVGFLLPSFDLATQTVVEWKHSNQILHLNELIFVNYCNMNAFVCTSVHLE